MSEELLSIAVDVARAAGALLLERAANARSEVSTKSSPTDMVTDADRASEASIVEALQRARPDDGILGEETGGSAGSSGMRWVVDPLDGTTNFLFGIPHWAVSIACEDERGPVAGVVYHAARDEMFAARRGGGATCNGRAMRVSEASDLSRALVATGFSYDPRERETGARVLAAVIARVRDVRRFGAASLDLAWVARGWFDCYYESHLAPWDAAAGRLLVVEAGGEVAEMPAIGPGGPGAIASAPGIAAPLRDLLRQALETI